MVRSGADDGFGARLNKGAKRDPDRINPEVESKDDDGLKDTGKKIY